ncbi:hypothetical protein LSTR_LSTR014436 [Laodelphax striatellus]|uniref:Uncharacterized protein n=1 Tax=Laodelphax striatellus TaxID=195883 RepID=A0A482XA16_LAOST|nr:hypothetical protein LSTR_LSTR014436 [Laodelphax striatellus]
MRPPSSQLGADYSNAENSDPNNMHPMMVCTRLAGRAIIRVVGRCNDAKENNNLEKVQNSVVFDHPNSILRTL